jgi:hypothetical protein
MAKQPAKRKSRKARTAKRHRKAATVMQENVQNPAPNEQLAATEPISNPEVTPEALPTEAPVLTEGETTGDVQTIGEPIDEQETEETL